QVKLELVSADPNDDPITVYLDQFQLGASLPITNVLGFPRPEKTTFSGFTATTRLNQATPDLLRALTNGQRFSTATLTETNDAGEPVAVWVLGNVYVTEQRVAGDPHEVAEHLTFNYGSITEVANRARAS